MNTKKQIDRQNKFIAEKYDRFTATFPKGKKEEYRKYAEQKGKSLNQLITSLLNEDMQRNGYRLDDSQSISNQNDSTQDNNQAETRNQSDNILNAPIEDLNLSIREYNLLKRYRIDTVFQWLILPYEEKTKRFIQRTIPKVDEAVADFLSQNKK